MLTDSEIAAIIKEARGHGICVICCWGKLDTTAPGWLQDLPDIKGQLMLHKKDIEVYLQQEIKNGIKLITRRNKARAKRGGNGGATKSG